MHDDNTLHSFIGGDKDVNPYPSPNSVPVTATRITEVITQTTSAMLESFRATYGQVDVVLLAILMLVVLVTLGIFAVRRNNG